MSRKSGRPQRPLFVLMKNYHYSMPQAFIEDKNVAIKWKLYALLNGYWLNGNTVYARNDTLATKLGVSERAIQSALAEIEKLGLCTRNISGMKRIILPGGIRGGRSPASCKGEAQLRAEGEAQLHHNSDSNSDSKKKVSPTLSPLKEKESKKKPMDIEYTNEDGEITMENGWPKRSSKKPKGEGKNKVALRLQHKFSDMCHSQIGIRPVSDIKGYQICLYALNTGGLTEDKVVDLFEEWFALGKTDEESVSITRALSARQIEGYKVRNNIQ